MRYPSSVVGGGSLIEADYPVNAGAAKVVPVFRRPNLPTCKGSELSNWDKRCLGELPHGRLYHCQNVRQGCETSTLQTDYNFTSRSPPERRSTELHHCQQDPAVE